MAPAVCLSVAWVVERECCAVPDDDRRIFRNVGAERVAGGLDVVAQREHAVLDDNGLPVEPTRHVERERTRAGLRKRARTAELAAAVERHVFIRKNRHIVRGHIGGD